MIFNLATLIIFLFLNTISCTLSRYKIFRKVQRGEMKRPNWWIVDEDIANSAHPAIPAQQPTEQRLVVPVNPYSNKQLER